MQPLIDALFAGGEDWQNAHSLMVSIASSTKKDELNQAVTYMKDALRAGRSGEPSGFSGSRCRTTVPLLHEDLKGR